MYSCGLCNCTFETEKESYEHDISDKHHRKFEETEKFYGRQARHFCSICNCGNIQGITCWHNHTRGARHRNSLISLYECYGEKGPDVNVESSTQSSRNGFKPVQKHAPGSSNSQTYSGKRSSHDVYQSSSDIKRDKFSSPMQPTKKSKVINTSDAQEGGMMLNILETIHKDSPTPRKNGKQAQKINTVSPKTKNSNICKQSAETSKGKQNNKMCTPVKTKTVKNKRIPECCEVTSHPITPENRSEVSSKVEDISKSQELLCMEKALIISQELQSLKIKQDELEEKLQNTEAELNLVRSKRRELKQQRSSLLKGLNHSDSDIESHADSSRSEVTDTRQNVALPIQKPSVKAVASIAPLDTFMNTIQSSDDSTICSNKSKMINRQPIDEPLPSTSYATGNRGQFDFEQQQQQHQQQQPHQHQQHQRNIPTSSPVAPETTFNIPSTSGISNTPTPILPQQPISDPHNSLPVNSTSNAVDLERLALIRQALQSPDSWQFTFDEVDQMLKQAAAKASANSASHRTTEVPQQPTQTSSRTDPSGPSNDTITSVPIKAEPTVYTTSEANEPSEHLSTNHTTVTKPNVSSAPTPSCLPQITSVHCVQPPGETIKTNHSSSSSFTSSDEETSNTHTRTAHDKSQISYPLKTQTETDTSSQTDIKLSTYSGSMSSSSSKGGIKIGEFHAFNGCTSAVIDMVVHPSTQVLYIGGQNGTIVECDLKTHQCITKLPLRDASITRLCLDPKGESIHVGYYDQYFADYSLSTGLLVHKNVFSSRIEAMAAAPSPDIPFIFLGLFGGDILRYNFKTHAIGFLCRHTSSYHQSESRVNKTDDVEQTTGRSQSNEPAGVTSLCLVQSGTSLLLIIGGLDRSISIVSASNGNLISSIQSCKQKGPPQGISSLPIGSFFSSFSDRSIRIYNWKTGAAELSFHVHKISSSCIMHRYIAVGDSEGAVRVYKFQPNGLPQTRPIKVYFISARGAVTSLVCAGDSLIAGSLDGSVTVILVNEPASDYTCLYGRKCGENCGLGFMDRRDLLHHVLNEHLHFGNKKTIMCGWGAGRCRVRFTETQTIRSISDHLLTHIPD